VSCPKPVERGAKRVTEPEKEEPQERLRMSGGNAPRFVMCEER